MGIYLKNSNGEYVKCIDTANEKLYLTTLQEEAYNYSGRPGGGRWDAENEKYFIEHYFKEDFGERVETLEPVYEESD